MEGFSPTQVRISIRRFQDYARDVLDANPETFSTFFKIFVSHCETDPVMRVISAQLKANTNVDFKKWFGEFSESALHSAGGIGYSLPLDEEDRLALLYQFLLAIDGGQVDVLEFGVQAYGETQLDSIVSEFNRQIFSKFVRDAGYRLEELQQAVEGRERIPSEELIIFQHFDKQVVISNINQSNVAVDGSTIVSSRTDSVGRLKQQLRELAEEVHRSKGSEEAAEALLQLAAAEDSTSKVKLATLVEVAVAREPTLKGKLAALVRNVGASLVANAIVAAIRFALGM